MPHRRSAEHATSHGVLGSCCGGACDGDGPGPGPGAGHAPLPPTPTLDGARPARLGGAAWLCSPRDLLHSSLHSPHRVLLSTMLALLRWENSKRGARSGRRGTEMLRAGGVGGSWTGGRRASCTAPSITSPCNATADPHVTPPISFPIGRRHGPTGHGPPAASSYSPHSLTPSIASCLVASSCLVTHTPTPTPRPIAHPSACNIARTLNSGRNEDIV
jgi:hypothetical protein